MPKATKRKERDCKGWACNTCNLVTREEGHPGLCKWCRCPEHRMLYTVEEMDQIEQTRKRFNPEFGPHDQPKVEPKAEPRVEQGSLFDDQDQS